MHGTIDFKRYLSLTPALVVVAGSDAFLEELLFHGLLMLGAASSSGPCSWRFWFLGSGEGFLPGIGNRCFSGLHIYVGCQHLWGSCRGTDGAQILGTGRSWEVIKGHEGCAI